MAYYANVAMEARVPTRNLVLTDHQSAFVDGLVASGRYQNASEALRAGLRLLEADEAMLAALRVRLSRGLAEADEGQLAPGSGAEAIRRAFVLARQGG